MALPKIEDIYLIYHGRYPSEKAHAKFVEKNCESFAALGYQVTLLVPNRKVAEELRANHQQPDSFRVIYLPTVDGLRFNFLKWIGFWVSNIYFSWQTARYLKRHAHDNSLVYTNEYLPLLFLQHFQTCLEIHDLKEQYRWFFRHCYKNADYILFTNQWKKDRFLELYPGIGAHCFVEQNAVDVEMFDIPVEQSTARTRLSLPEHEQIVMYTGHLYGWKGVSTLAEAAKQLSNCRFYFVGGTMADVKAFRDTYGDMENIHIIGYRPHKEIPLWQKAADVLILPNTAKESISKYYTSPMKLFEYLASGRPVVASDVPSIRELVDDSIVTFFTPDDPSELAQAISDIINNHTLDSKRTQYSQAFVERYTWEKRAIRIFQHLGST